MAAARFEREMGEIDVLRHPQQHHAVDLVPSMVRDAKREKVRDWVGAKPE